MLTLTPARLASVYEMLRAFPPFSQWKLPPCSSVKFRVIRSRFKHADYSPPPTETIRVSTNCTGHLQTVTQAIAHEMCHQRLKHVGSAGWASHGKEFQALARQVSRRFGWDEKQF